CFISSSSKADKQRRLCHKNSKQIKRLTEGFFMPSTYQDRTLKVFSLNSNRKLAEEIANHIGTPLGKCTVSEFSDVEIPITIHECVRTNYVSVVQSACSPVNKHIMVVIIIIDALIRASAQ